MSSGARTNSVPPVLDFDPDGAAVYNGLFGLPHVPKNAAVVCIPVPWNATHLDRNCTVNGPATILEASHRIGLINPDVAEPWKPGIAMLPISSKIIALNRQAYLDANPIIKAGGGVKGSKSLTKRLASVNRACGQMNAWVKNTTTHWRNRGKIVCLIGGDHSTMLGYLQAMHESVGDFTLLHIDAHADVRPTFEGFAFSHASVIYNACETIPGLAKRTVMVGIRDVGQNELVYIKNNGIKIASGHLINRSINSGAVAWWDVQSEILRALRQDLPIVVSFDVDGLNPELCPHTGTPVPGGLSFDQATMLITEVAMNRKVVGFGLVEVAPDPTGYTVIDGCVGARIFYHLYATTLASNNLAERQEPY
jgi:agmatinase